MAWRANSRFPTADHLWRTTTTTLNQVLPSRFFFKKERMGIQFEMMKVPSLEASEKTILGTFSSGPLASFARIGCGGVFGGIADEKPVFLFLYPA